MHLLRETKHCRAIRRKNVKTKRLNLAKNNHFGFVLLETTRPCTKQYKCLIALILSNASDYICRYFHPLIRKIGKYGNIFFENLKI